MILSKLFAPQDPISIRGSKDKEILGIRTNSKEVRPKDLFIALSPNRSYMDEAILSGAAAIVVDIFNPFLPKEITQIEHQNPKEYAGILANRFYQNPSQHLKILGVTGTSGKSTTTWMIRHLLGEDHCGVIGTLGALMKTHSVEVPLTTPEPVTICRLLQEMVKENLSYCAMECSSHGLDQNRVSHLEFEGAIFLNLTQDHLDYHQTFEDYYQAKKKLFLLATKKQVINIDDPYGMRLYNELSNRSITIGQDPRADYRIKEVVLTLQSSSCLLEHKNSNFLVELPMIGSYHLYNMVAAIALAHQEGQSLEALCDLSKSFQSVPGRSEMITTSMGFSIMVDYAHKPDALLKLLKSLREAGAKKITTIFGCGGERDQMKRPMMAKIAEQLSDRVIVTTDNPRKEDPHQIIQQILQGLEKNNFEAIVARKSALLNGLKNAQKGEVILIAGRGHEKEQKLKTASIPFLDSEVAKNLLIGI